MEENLPMTSVETDSYVAVQLLEKNKSPRLRQPEIYG